MNGGEEGGVEGNCNANKNKFVEKGKCVKTFQQRPGVNPIKTK